MKTYFIHNGISQDGPFTFEELKSKSINSTTSVWTEGMDEWKPASEFFELQLLFASPPPFSGNKAADRERELYNMPATPKRKGRKILWIAATLLICGGVVFYVNADPAATTRPYEFFSEPERVKTPEELRAELLKRERFNPREYLSIDWESHENLIDQTVLKGKIYNKATMANFKDVVLELQWLTKTDTELQRELVTIYDFVGPNSSAKFKFKTYSPAGAANLKIIVKSASPVN